ncbi:MAG: LysM peptidoglycan-binding domain-containing protein [Thermodesulfobacteriota bacterium]|jgi:LysM repeat protein
MENRLEDRKEPLVEVSHIPEGPSFSSGYQPRSTRSLSFNKWVLAPILLLGIAGLAFGLWMVIQSGGFSSKKQTEFPELTTLKGEVQKLKVESDSLKNEIQSLKKGQKAFEEQTKVLQGQVTAMKGQLASLAKKRDAFEDKKPGSKAFVYKIKNGDTLNLIAKKFRVSPDDLRRWNRLPLKGKPQPGQIITIYSSIP